MGGCNRGNTAIITLVHYLQEQRGCFLKSCLLLKSGVMMSELKSLRNLPHTFPFKSFFFFPDRWFGLEKQDFFSLTCNFGAASEKK